MKLFENIHIREPSDFEFIEVAQFSYENFVQETALSSGKSAESLKEKFGGPPVKRSERDVWLVVHEGSKRIGFVWFQLVPKENSAFGMDIYLEPTHRSKGLGRHLMQYCRKELLKRGVRSVKICVFEGNEIARKLYDSLGFTPEKFDEERRQHTLSLELS